MCVHMCVVCVGSLLHELVPIRMHLELHTQHWDLLELIAGVVSIGRGRRLDNAL